MAVKQKMVLLIDKMKNIIKTYTQPSFLICILVLAVAGASQSYVIKQLGIQLIKLPISLKKPLEMLEQFDLSPYKVINKHKIKNKDVLENLGTEEYIQWELEDISADKSSNTKYCSLFITYYTGNPDQVPHVPDECYVGGGNQRLASDIVGLNLKSDSGNNTEQARKINAKYIVFSRKSSDMWQVSSKFPVMYFFHANGEYSGSRTETRKIMGKNLLGKYSYFAKVEWKFYGRGYRGNVYPDKKEIVEASEKFFSVLLDIMDKEFWPDWDKANPDKQSE